MGIKDIDLRNGSSLPIRQFKFDDMVENAAIVMVAKRGSGKSWVVRALMHHYRKIPVGMILSPTDRMSSFYNNFFPDSYIHYEYKTELIQKILARQTEIIEKKQKREEHGKKLDERGYIIMDDCLSSKGTWMRDQPIQELLFNGRHYKLMYILTMQYPLGITPELRSNFDYFFLLKEETVSNQKRIYDHYAGMLPNFTSFVQVFTKLTLDNNCMVIDNKRNVTNPLERIFWYKAPNLTGIQVKLGCKQFQLFHKNNYNKDWKISNLNNKVDYGSWCTQIKKSKVVINVEKQEVDDDGHVIDPKQKALQKFKNK